MANNSIYGPNSGNYLKGLEQAFTGKVNNYDAQQEAYKLPQKAFNYGKQAYSAYKAFTAAPQAYNLAMGTGQGANALGQGTALTTQAAPQFVAPLAAPTMGPTVAAAGSATAAGAEAGVGAGAGAGAAAGSETGAAVGAGASGASMAMPIIGLALAIGSSKPGDALFGAKQLMYNVGTKQAGETTPGNVLERWAYGNNRTNNINNHLMTGNIHGIMNYFFGDPNEQLAQQRGLNEAKSRITALRGAFNLQKALDPITGKPNDQPDDQTA